MQYVKLFQSILDSTIWQEPITTKVVWITMLALADKHGEVFASIPGLARRAGVTIEEAEKALTCLLSPDQYSRTKDFDGRRIQEIDGGWVLLNHPKYRALLSEAERREYNRVKKQESRARSLGGMSNDVNDGQQMSALSAHTDSVSASQAKEDSDQLPPNPPRGTLALGLIREMMSDELPLEIPVTPQRKVRERKRFEDHPGFDDFWSIYPRKDDKKDAIQSWNKEKPDLQVVMEALSWQVPMWTEPQYIPLPTTYLNKRRFENQPPVIVKPKPEQVYQ
jgi:hypothetical protein